MVKIRLQEILEEQELSIENLCVAAAISEDLVCRMMDSDIQINAENSDILRKIGTALVSLGAPCPDLFASTTEKNPSAFIESKRIIENKHETVELQILELLGRKKMSVQDLSNVTKINFDMIAIYSTQPIQKNVLNEVRFQEDLKRICEVLNCKTNDLLLESTLPKKRFEVREFMEDKGITQKDLSKLTQMSPEALDFFANQPLDVNAFRRNPLINEWKNNMCCGLLPLCCHSVDS